MNHGTQVRRNHRHGVEHHAARRISRVQERGNDLQALQRTGLLLTLARRDDLLQRSRLTGKIEGLQTLLNGFGAHAAVEPASVAITHLPEQHLVTLEILNLQRAESVEDPIETVNLLIGSPADSRHLPLAGFAHLAADVRLRALCFEFGEVGFQLLLPSLNVRVPT